MLQENKKCVAELESAKKSIEHFKRVVNVSVENAPRKAIIQNRKKMNFSHNKKILPVLPEKQTRFLIILIQWEQVLMFLQMGFKEMVT